MADKKVTQAILNWLSRKLDLYALRVAFGANMREFALLWLVFSLLDLFISDKLTPRWILGNSLFTLFVWLLGAYIEMKRSVERERM
jgi:hypothetical protein